jgi:hypothetical protein
MSRITRNAQYQCIRAHRKRTPLEWLQQPVNIGEIAARIGQVSAAD